MNGAFINECDITSPTNWFLMRPIYIKNYILILKQVVLITRVVFRVVFIAELYCTYLLNKLAIYFLFINFLVGAYLLSTFKSLLSLDTSSSNANDNFRPDSMEFPEDEPRSMGHHSYCNICKKNPTDFYFQSIYRWIGKRQIMPTGQTTFLWCWYLMQCDVNLHFAYYLSIT